MSTLAALSQRALGLLQRSSRSASLLGLAIDRGQLHGVSLLRTNGSVQVQQPFSAPLSLNLLTDEPELVGREIRKQLDAAGIRERRCSVCLPLNWALTLDLQLPDLPEEDLESFLQIEAERGFPYSPEALILAHSRYRSPKGESCATLVAVPREHLARLESALEAAQLRPLSLSFGITALQPPASDPAEGALALLAGQDSIGLLLTAGGGVVALRTIEGAFEHEGGSALLQTDEVAREIRITLGQLSPEIRESVRRLVVLGQGDRADELAAALSESAHALGLRIDRVRQYTHTPNGVEIPPGTPVSPALGLALGHLAGQGAAFEFFTPKPGIWQRFLAGYPSRRLVWAAAAAGSVVAAVALAFLIQQWQIARWQSRWNDMRARVTELESLQHQIRKYRPWFDDSIRSLSILRRLTEAFPEDGSVSAKTVELRPPTTVVCSGTSRDNPALLRVLDKLRGLPEVSSVQVETIRGSSPMQFTFNFQWQEAGSP